jgi:hypothetical protein
VLGVRARRFPLALSGVSTLLRLSCVAARSGGLLVGNRLLPLGTKLTAGRLIAVLPGKLPAIVEPSLAHSAQGRCQQPDHDQDTDHDQDDCECAHFDSFG